MTMGSVAPGSSLNNSVVLTDPSGSIVTDFNQQFTPGDTLGFTVHATTQFTGPTPDNFSFSILDRTGTPIPTNDPSGASTFFNVDLVPNPDLDRVYSATQAPTIGPPTVTPVPEPGSLALVAVGLAALGLMHVVRGRAEPSRARASGALGTGSATGIPI